MWDEDLVGLWDSGPYDYGVMESSWVCLRADGTGWSAWANVGGASLSQLTWICPQEGKVELRYTWTALGPGFPGTPPALIEVDEEGPDDTLVRTCFAISLDTPPIGGPPVTTLHFEESVESCRRFGLLTREVDHLLARSQPEQGLSSTP
ncbi:hypothetical protein [Micromonospora sp. NPDC002575]|uniref:hypothetical protein n=1 Tax=Micromonospora sp. NPDC002575 TaxID=3364222 RepID=UPI00369ADBD5